MADFTRPETAADLLLRRREAMESLESYAAYIDIPDRPIVEGEGASEYAFVDGHPAVCGTQAWAAYDHGATGCCEVDVYLRGRADLDHG